MYIKEDNQWRAYRASNRQTQRNYIQTEFIYQELHLLADYLATCHGDTTISLESSRLWYYTQQDLDPINYDPYAGEFTTIDDAFFDAYQSPRILLDKYTLPKDNNCLAIAEALQQGTAKLVSDGSYYKDKEAGGSAFTLTPGKINTNLQVSMEAFQSLLY